MAIRKKISKKINEKSEKTSGFFFWVDEEMAERKKNWELKMPEVKGYLKKYAAMVTSANTGAVLKVKD